MKKHSYRELNKRNFSKSVLFYIEDPEDAKGIFEFTPTLTQKEKAEYERAFSTGQHLIDEFKANKPLNLTQFTPYIKSIEAALNRHVNGIQTTLF